MVKAGQVHSFRLAALAGHGRPDVAHPERVTHADGPRAFDLAAHSRQARTGLARGDDMAQPERLGHETGLLRPSREIGRKRERPEDRGDPQGWYQLEQATR